MLGMCLFSRFRRDVSISCLCVLQAVVVCMLMRKRLEAADELVELVNEQECLKYEQVGCVSGQRNRTESD